MARSGERISCERPSASTPWSWRSAAYSAWRASMSCTAGEPAATLEAVYATGRGLRAFTSRNGSEQFGLRGRLARRDELAHVRRRQMSEPQARMGLPETLLQQLREGAFAAHAGAES